MSDDRFIERRLRAALAIINQPKALADLDVILDEFLGARAILTRWMDWYGRGEWGNSPVVDTGEFLHDTRIAQEGGDMSPGDNA